MNHQRLQLVIIAILAIVCVTVGYSSYLRNKEIASIQNSLVSLSDSQRVAARQRAATVISGDPAAARLKLQTCGLVTSADQFPTAEEMNEVLPYVARNEQIATFVAKGMELSDACVDDSESQRILFLGATLRRNGRSEATFGTLDEAYPQLGTITTVPDSMNLLVAATPANCAILGNGASPESQFLVHCDDFDPRTSLSFQRGYVMDFVKREAIEIYRCNDLQDNECEAVDRSVYEANKAFLDPKVVKQMR